jgi:hypothetical protein
MEIVLLPDARRKSVFTVNQSNRNFMLYRLIVNPSFGALVPPTRKIRCFRATTTTP